MAVIQVDWELCRMILILAEELVELPDLSAPYELEFDGFSKEIVGFNMRQLHIEGLIEIAIPSKQRGPWEIYPIGIKKKGVEFLDITRDRMIWREAAESIEARNETPTYLKMRKALGEATVKNASRF